MKGQIVLPQLPRLDSSGNINQSELMSFLIALQKVLDSKQKEDYNANQSMFNEIVDMFFPIGAGKYIQISETDGTFPEEDEPEVKFGGTWELVFDDEGVFFRTEGGDADESRSEETGIQPSALGTHRHLVIVVANYNTSTCNADYAIASNSSEGSDTEYELDSNTLYDANAGRSSLPVEGVYSENETRSINRLIRVWRRIA